MQRWHQEQAISFRHRREHNRFAHEGNSTGCLCDEQLGRFRKQRGMGCRRTRCQVCHFEKVRGIESYHERLADLCFCEQLVNHG